MTAPMWTAMSIPMAQWLNAWSLLTCTFFILLVPGRLLALRDANVKISNERTFTLKVSLAAAFLLSEIFLVILRLDESDTLHPFVALSVVMRLVAAIAVLPLSLLEHIRSLRPSTLLSLFLVATTVKDVLRLTFLTTGDSWEDIKISLVVHLCFTVSLLLAEGQSKQSYLLPEYQNLSPEELSGGFSTSTLLWILPIIVQGYRKILSVADLPHLQRDMLSEVLKARMIDIWEHRVKPEPRTSLLQSLCRCLFWPFVFAVPSRLCLTLFRYAQPVLINWSIRYVSTGPRDPGGAYEIIAATLVIYVGLAISTSIYQAQLDRLKIMVKSSLVGLIHHQALIRDTTNEKANDGRAVALMSTDVDSICSIAETFHEAWAQVLEFLIGMMLLIQQIGWISPVLLICIFGCSRTSRYVAKNLRPKQLAWNAATQRRLAIISSALASIKSLKTIGAARAVTDDITKARKEEIDRSKDHRWIMVGFNSSANALGIFSPAITFILFAVIAKVQGRAALDAKTAFTSVALLALVTHPANMVMTMVPRAVAAFAGFERIQEYLTEPNSTDQRAMTPEFLLEPGKRRTVTSPAIALNDVSIAIPLDSSPILRGLNFVVPRGGLVICTGATGTGKTLLCRALLGDLNVVKGAICVFSKNMAYCAQSPWLPNGSIKDAICGRHSNTAVDSAWYDRVIRICCLHRDLQLLPMHDQTEVGSRGINLSGGQRQRVALARALFTRSKILVLDDPFSALDGETKHEIIHNLFGPKGLLRSMGVTVFLVSHATDSFHLADHILVLGNSGILAQGPWSKIKATYGNIADIIHERQKAESTDKFQQVSTVDVSQRLVADKEADLSRKTGDIAIYAYYLRSIGKTNCSILVLCCSAYAFAVIFPQYWLKWWTEADGADMWFYVGGYAFLSFTAWLSTSMITWLTYIRIAPQSGASLHSGLLKTIFGAQLSYFFIADTGTILNRFGQDIQMVDRDIPNTLAGLGVQIFRMIMQAALLLSVQRLLALTLPICMAIIYILQKFYLQTSRQLRLLELESRAAVYSSFLETVDGLTTIRAMGWQEEYSEQNDHCLDEFQRPTYLLFCLQRWLNVVLNLMVAGIAVVVIAITVLYQSSSSGAEIGISLNIILVTNTTLLRLVDFWTTLEISLGAVARLKNLESETPQELDEIKTVEPDAAWPRDGSCEIRDVQVSYNSRAIALRNVNISISGGQKVLICGKTGSGKSTLFLALLRLLELQKGFIKVDGVDISHVPRSTIRERCFITMPQDTYISPNGSLRSNLDFYAEYTDEQIISALTRTQLWHHVSGPSRQSSNVDTPPTDFAILSLSMADLPPLSFGQMQLFALTRALLRSYEPTAHNGVQRPKPTLLLDEATSSLDEDSEELIHRLIDESFTAKGFTVIVIAHRIAAAAKWMRAGQDLVVRMDRGTVEEVKVFDGQI